MDVRRLISLSSSCMLIVRCPLVTTDTLWTCTLWCNSNIFCSNKCWKKSRLSIIYNVAGPSICFSDRFISRSSIFNSVCHASSQTVCVLFLPGFWGMLQYTEKRRKDTILTVFTAGKEKEAFSLKSTGFLVNLSSAHTQLRRKQGTLNCP